MARRGAGAFALAVLVHPAPALASDPTGVLTVMYAMFVLGPWLGLNFLLFLGLAFSGAYANARTAKIHTAVGAVAPALGLALAVFEFGLRSAVTPYVAAAGVALAITSLPYVVHRARHDL